MFERQCCRDTKRVMKPRVPVEGLELPCRWCDNYYRYDNGRWHLHDGFVERLDRSLAAAQEAVARERGTR